MGRGVSGRVSGPDLSGYLFKPADALRERRENARDSRHREAYDNNSYRVAITRACDAAFDPKGERIKAGDTSHRWRPNQLRHAAKNRIERAHGLEAARLLLGHSHASTTEMYGQRDMRAAIQAAQKSG